MKFNTGKASSMPAGIILGGISALVITLIGIGVLAKLLEREVLPENALGYGIMLVLILSSFAGSILARGKIKRRKALVCMSTGGVYLLILLSITALAFGGEYSGVGVTVLLILCGSALAILTQTTPRKQRNVAKIKMKNW